MKKAGRPRAGRKIPFYVVYVAQEHCRLNSLLGIKKCGVTFFRHAEALTIDYFAFLDPDFLMIFFSLAEKVGRAEKSNSLPRENHL